MAHTKYSINVSYSDSMMMMIIFLSFQYFKPVTLKGKVSNSGQKLCNLGFSVSSSINTSLLLIAGIPVCLSGADRKTRVCGAVREAQTGFYLTCPADDKEPAPQLLFPVVGLFEATDRLLS